MYQMLQIYKGADKERKKKLERSIPVHEGKNVEETKGTQWVHTRYQPALQIHKNCPRSESTTINWVAHLFSYNAQIFLTLKVDQRP